MKTKLKRKTESGIAAIWWLIIGIAVVVPNVVIILVYVIYWGFKSIDGTPLPLPQKPAALAPAAPEAGGLEPLLERRWRISE